MEENKNEQETITEEVVPEASPSPPTIRGLYADGDVINYGVALMAAAVVSSRQNGFKAVSLGFTDIFFLDKLIQTLRERTDVTNKLHHTVVTRDEEMVAKLDKLGCFLTDLNDPSSHVCMSDIVGLVAEIKDMARRFL